MGGYTRGCCCVVDVFAEWRVIPEDVVALLELAKVSKILALVDCLRKQCSGLKLALMDEGNINQAIGRSLNDIDVPGGKKEQI